MPTLEIAVDARGVEQGLRQANKALDETAQKADRAEREVKQMGQASHQAGRDMGAAFAATGGGLAVTHGLVGITDGFRRADGAMAAFAASQALLDLGRFAEDMKNVTAATGGTAGVMSKLAEVMKAHPLLTIATALAGAASFMGVFAKETEEAADEFERLGEAIEKVRVSREARQILGLEILPAEQQRLGVVQGTAEKLAARMRRGQGVTYGELSEELGLDFRQLQQLQVRGGQGFIRPRTAGFAIDPTDPTAGMFPGRRFDIAGTQAPTAAAQAILRTHYADIRKQIEQLTASGKLSASITGGAGAAPLEFPLPAYAPKRTDFGISFADPRAEGPFLRGGVMYPSSYGTGEMLMRRPGDPGTFGYQPPSGPGLSGGMGMVGYGINMGMQTLTQMQAFANEQALEAENRMRELVSLGETFGQTIGDAFFRVAEGTMTARQAMAELVRQFAQMAAQSAFRGIGGQLFGSFAPTQTQATADGG